MNASEDVVLAYWKDQREQLRQSEIQRATLTNFLLVITAALSALIIQQKFDDFTIPLCIFVALLGLYGALTVAKYYERAAYHQSQARALTSTLATMGALGSDDALDKNRASHYERFPILHRLRLHHLWVVLHLGIFLYGITLLVLSFIF
jgi:uncharacterized membrane protein